MYDMQQDSYHSRDTSRGTNIRGNTFQGHDGARTGLFGNASLLSVHDVHDNSTLQAYEHARKSDAGFSC